MLLLRGGLSLCELTLILSGATTSSAAKSMWNQWIVWPVYNIVLFIDFTSQRCWKTVLISSINVSFIIYIEPITFTFCITFSLEWFMLTICTFF